MGKSHVKAVSSKKQKKAEGEGGAAAKEAAAAARKKIRQQELEDAQLTATARFMKKVKEAGLVRDDEHAAQLKELAMRMLTRRPKVKDVHINYKKYLVALHRANVDASHFTGQTPGANYLLNRCMQNMQRWLVNKMKDKAFTLKRTSHTLKAMEPIVAHLFGPGAPFQEDRKNVMARIKHHVRLYESSLAADEREKLKAMSEEDRLKHLKKVQKKEQQKEDPQPMEEEGESEEEESKEDEEEEEEKKEEEGEDEE